MHRTRVVSIIGRQGSGKTTVGRALASILGCAHIEASDVVKSLCGDLTRADMPSTNKRTAEEPWWLGDAIFDAITSNLLGTQDAVVTGIREVEVHNTLVYKHACKVYPVKLFADQETRYERLLGEKCFTWKEFNEHEQNEGSIGLDKLLLQEYPVSYYTNKVTSPRFIADDIVEKLIVRENR